MALLEGEAKLTHKVVDLALMMPVGGMQRSRPSVNKDRYGSKLFSLIQFFGQLHARARKVGRLGARLGSSGALTFAGDLRPDVSRGAIFCKWGFVTHPPECAVLDR